ncbi:MAG: Verru_Chthon cassette protein C [Fimbriimonadaceae bacterium]
MLGFTLVEVMVSMVVLAIMMMLIAQIIGQTQKSWRMASTRLSQFREARIAFDTITRNLRQSTLDAYRDFVYSNGTNIPKSNRPEDFPVGYKRYADLAFVSGQAKDLVKSSDDDSENLSETSLSGHAVFFQAPLGVTDPADKDSPQENGRPKYENLKNLLCARGYFVQFGSNKNYLPKHLISRLEETNRFRLMEYQPPAEKNNVYVDPGSEDWKKVDSDYVRPVSDKIVGLILSPRLSSGNESINIGGSKQSPTAIAPNYEYDSNKVTSVTVSNAQGTQYLLPPVVKVTMIAVDEASMEILAKGSPDVLSESGGQFTNASNYDADLNKVRQYLGGKKINYRIFEASVVIPASRWAL